jgi:cation transport ATPase
MFEQISSSVRRLTGAGQSGSGTPLVRVGDAPNEAVHTAQADIGMLRGVTDASADTADCVCPEPCERDHANE